MQKNRFYSIWLSLLLIAIFILQNLIPNFTETLILNSNSYLQLWRFLTAIFLHGSLAHLLSNLFALIIFGLILENIIGSRKFLLVFLISGILTNVISVFFYPSSLGASGAIMSIIGALAIIKPMMGIWAFGMIIPVFIAAIIWIFVDLFGVFIPDNVGHIAHILGIVFGIVFGALFRFRNKTQSKRHRIHVPEHIMRRWEALYFK
ncbi:MAG: rhomboid family intramembrane serine protease [Candidatus Pacearchaeota archaeon]